MKRLALPFLFICIGIIIGYIWRSFSAPPAINYEYAALNTDLDLELEDRNTSVNYGKQEIQFLDNPKMFGSVKKGSIVQMPTNVIRKGNRVWIKISAFVEQNQLLRIGDDDALRKYLKDNESFYSQSKTGKGKTKELPVPFEGSI